MQQPSWLSIRMLKTLLTIIVVITIGYSHIAAETRALANPQVHMHGARYGALGGTNPAIQGDITGLFINPAVVNNLNYMPFALSSKRLLGHFQYLTLNSSMPAEIPIPLKDKTLFQEVAFGLSYGNLLLENIPKTLLDNDRIFAIDSYKAGFNILQATIGTSFYDVFGFNRLSGGLGTKVFNEYIGADTRNSISFDLGLIATYHIINPYVSRVFFGGSILNTFSTPLKWSTGEQSLLPFQFFIGTGATLLDETLLLYLNNTINGFAISSEYKVDEKFVFRGGTTFNKLMFGIGIHFASIAGISYSDYMIRLDYSYQQGMFPFNEDPTHIVSLAILGESTPRRAKIITPEKPILTNQYDYKIGGIGPSNTALRVFTNKTLRRTAQTNGFGRWSIDDYPLQEGLNKITIKTFSLGQDISEESNQVKITRDTIIPTLNIQILPEEGSIALIQVKVQEELKTLKGLFEDSKLTFTQSDSLTWETQFSLPDNLINYAYAGKEMSNLQFYAEDLATNKTPVETLPIFLKVDFPKDKYVNYKPQIRILGSTSRIVNELKLQNIRLAIDNEDNFSGTTQLKPGKNLLKLEILTNEKSIPLTYTMRVLRIKTFKDLTKKIKARREIEFLATLGVLDGDKDNLFRPNKLIDRLYVTKLLVNLLKYKVEKIVEEDVLEDIPADHPGAPYVKVAIEEGLIFTYPDGTFKPDQPLTLNEIVFLMSNSDIIEEQEDLEGGDEYIARKDFAKFLAYTPKYDRKIQRLIDWEKGYK